MQNKPRPAQKDALHSRTKRNQEQRSTLDDEGRDLEDAYFLGRPSAVPNAKMVVVVVKELFHCLVKSVVMMPFLMGVACRCRKKKENKKI